MVKNVALLSCLLLVFQVRISQAASSDPGSGAAASSLPTAGLVVELAQGRQFELEREAILQENWRLREANGVLLQDNARLRQAADENNFRREVSENTWRRILDREQQLRERERRLDDRSQLLETMTNQLRQAQEDAAQVLEYGHRLIGRGRLADEREQRLHERERRLTNQLDTATIQLEAISNRPTHRTESNIMTGVKLMGCLGGTIACVAFGIFISEKLFSKVTGNN